MRSLPFHALTFSIVLFLLYTVDHAVSENNFEQYEDLEMDTIEGLLDNEIDELKEKLQKKIGAHEPTETNSDKGEEERKDRHDAERQPAAQVLKPTYTQHNTDETGQDRYDRKPTYTKHNTDETGQANMATEGKPKPSRAQTTRRRWSGSSSLKKSSRRQIKDHVRKPQYRRRSTPQRRPSRLSKNTGDIMTNRNGESGYKKGIRI